MKKTVTLGYASIDYVAVLDGYFQPNCTTPIKKRPADAFPRPGGCSLYVAGPIADSGCQSAVVTWVGDDDLGNLYRSFAQKHNIDYAGISTLDHSKTPVCFLIYQEDASCVCLFDPGFMGRERLTPQQIQLIKEAELVTFTVGPPQIALEVLNYITETTKVGWVGKNDAQSYPEELKAVLGKRADYIFCNRHERSMMDASLTGRQRPAPMILETDGGNRVKIELQGDVDFIDVPSVTFDEATGAGDTLAGGCLAAIINGCTDLNKIGQSGVQAATKLLQQRSY